MIKKTAFLLFGCMLFGTTLIAQHEDSDDFGNEVNQHDSFYKTDTNELGLFDHYDQSNDFGTYHFVPAAQSLRYNRVDALFLGLGTDFGVQNSNLFEVNGLLVDGFLGYSTGLKEWQYRAGVSKPFGNHFVIGGEILSTSTTDDYWRTDLEENSITSIVAGYDYHDYYKAEGYSIFSTIKFGSAVSLSGSYNYTQYSSLANNTGYSFFGDGNLERLNPAIDSNFDLINQETVGLNLVIDDKERRSSNFHTKWVMSADISDNALSSNNDFSYNKFEITSLNSIRIDRNTVLKTRFKGGSITGEAPDFKNFYLGGIGTMRASGYKFYSGDKMLLSNAEIIFGDFWSFDAANIDVEGMFISLFLDSGWAEFSNSTSNDPFSGFESFSFADLNHNIGTGIGFDFLRFEVATPLAGSEGATTFWVRLNTSF